jgi:hypothetical protein
MNNSSYDCAGVLKWMQESNLHDQWHVAIDNKPLEGILTIEQVRHLTWDPRYEKTIIQILNVQHANTPNPVWLVIGERLSSTTKTDPTKTDLVSILTMGIGVCALPLTAFYFLPAEAKKGSLLRLSY